MNINFHLQIWNKWKQNRFGKKKIKTSLISLLDFKCLAEHPNRNTLLAVRSRTAALIEIVKQTEARDNHFSQYLSDMMLLTSQQLLTYYSGVRRCEYGVFLALFAFLTASFHFFFMNTLMEKEARMETNTADWLSYPWTKTLITSCAFPTFGALCLRNPIFWVYFR